MSGGRPVGHHANPGASPAPDKQRDHPAKQDAAVGHGQVPPLAPGAPEHARWRGAGAGPACIIIGLACSCGSLILQHPAVFGSAYVLVERRRRPNRRISALKASGDLVERGYLPDQVVWFYKLDTDRDIHGRYPHGWREFDYLVSTATLRSFPDHLPQAPEAQRRSNVVASFGRGSQRVEIRKVQDSPV
jgi:hypothetical protein